MIEMTLREIADVVGGTLHDVPDPEVRVTGSVEFDSRRIGSGDLFLALPGGRADGHDYAPAAVAAGAVAVLAARPVGVPAIVVTPNPGAVPANSMAVSHDSDGSGAAVLTALAALARASVEKLTAAGSLTVVGVTGSSGKTSTKDLLAAVLAPLGPVVAPPGSFNNELGHPWTALRADENTRFLVLELSARGPGHIAALARVAPPSIGVVLNVGTAHLGEFGSREAIAQTKGELVEALPATGVAVLNADDGQVAAMASRTSARVVTVGRSGDADLRATDVRLDDGARARFTLHAPSGSVEIALAVHGEHQVGNALSAAAVALACGADLDTVATALAGARAASERRMDVRDTDDGVTVVNDSYNANPDSVRAALKALVTMAKAGAAPRRSWAVLGEMAELGEESVLEHDGIGRLAVRLDVDRLVVVGTGRPSRAMHQGAVMEGSWGEESVLVPDIGAAIALLDDEVEAGDVVLVKASKSVGLWAVADHLTGADRARGRRGSSTEAVQVRERETGPSDSGAQS
ncbi:UDP-N-acetylmuramoyl-tripeptide--D-alanyl-D-alanine ligase [Nocardia puris]|uniref:UDP-N-acetylmuramoyl-tripeptide--D-alanyl-D-alanine ligase n=1 Tax=Nocardia puris TaxID=208602 RepID=A0A366DLR8_9NOCA|nr:UDP-N-acetylmuramoyl-tripeptide--D-alanyl-D-alanine ligase [Nocardia puris]MBF6212931.1 UDP-N-acetylmuramoyl-tripeptide--D-alanyl-D-alanine ligase [Nocardia puris]MBF6367922.1 UDP-N-acetylmuramoyl-tripeptide--D-alanyl-D-alanine ligase [Nocardia puris]MBF6463271.1 UDP-N-acetylmuramoyl-tripeptide--D-alanyl-D-alanine ligase [Nocardia puris]RBO90178.1 UDP-N-acetylmuramoyl-tripeptide--D-alanyl-D-alanine ligase [Nocardia puris]